MKSGIDQAKLTAYALGELRGKEAEEIEAIAKSDPEVRKYIDEVRLLGKELEFELSDEPVAVVKAKSFFGIKFLNSKFAEAAAGVLILFLIAFPARHRFLDLVGVHHDSAAPTADEQVIAGDNLEAMAFLDAVAARPTEEAAVRDCRFEVPRLFRQDLKGQIVDSVLEGLQGKNLQLSYLSTNSAELYKLAVLVGNVAGSTFKSDPKDIVKSEGDFQFVTHHTDTQSSVVFGFTGAAAAYYCWVSVTLEGKLKGSAFSDISTKIQNLAEKVALSLAGKKAPGSSR
jgi:hypothetical protein